MTKKSAMRIGAIVFALVLLIGIVTAVGYSLFNKKNETNVNSFGENMHGGLSITPNGMKDSKISLVSSPIFAKSREMVGNGIERESSLSDSVSITATIKPDYVQDKSVIWTLVGEDSSLYIELSSTTESTITVSCKEEFNNPIVLTVEAKSNSEITNSVTINYEKRVSDLRFNIPGEAYGAAFSSAIALDSVTDATTLLTSENISDRVWAIWSGGTLDANGRITATLQYDTQYVKDMCEALNSVRPGLSYDSTMCDEHDKFYISDVHLIFDFLKGSSYKVMVAQNFGTFAEAAIPCLAKYAGVEIAHLKITVTCNYATYTKTYGLLYPRSIPQLAVKSSIEVSENNVTF